MIFSRALLLEERQGCHRLQVHRLAHETIRVHNAHRSMAASVSFQVLCILCPTFHDRSVSQLLQIRLSLFEVLSVRSTCGNLQLNLDDAYHVIVIAILIACNLGTVPAFDCVADIVPCSTSVNLRHMVSAPFLPSMALLTWAFSSQIASGEGSKVEYLAEYYLGDNGNKSPGP